MTSVSRALPLLFTLFAGLSGCVLNISPDGRQCTAEGICTEGYSCVDGICEVDDDTIRRDGGEIDAGRFDGGLTAQDAGPIGDAGGEPEDGGPTDAGVVDAGTHDAGTDAGSDDGGAVDAGDDDAGTVDGGKDDAGPVDGGADGGAVDAGLGDGGSDGGPVLKVAMRASPETVTYNNASQILWVDAEFGPCDVIVGGEVVAPDVTFLTGTPVYAPPGVLGDFTVGLACSSADGPAFGEITVAVEPNVTVESAEDLTHLVRYREIPGDVVFDPDLSMPSSPLVFVESIGGTLRYESERITGLLLPFLERAGGVSLTASALTTLDLQVLAHVTGAFTVDGTSVTSVSLPDLETVATLTLNGNETLSALDLSSLQTISTSATITNNTVLPMCRVIESLDGIAVPLGTVTGNLDEAGPCANGWTCPTSLYGGGPDCSCGCGAAEVACATDDVAICLDPQCPAMQIPSPFDTTQCVVDLGLTATLTPLALDFRTVATLQWSTLNSTNCDLFIDDVVVLSGIGESGTLPIEPAELSDFNVEIRCAGASGDEFASWPVTVNQDVEFHCTPADLAALANYPVIPGSLSFDQTNCAADDITFANLEELGDLHLYGEGTPSTQFPVLTFLGGVHAASQGKGVIDVGTVFSAPILTTISGRMRFTYGADDLLLDLPLLTTTDSLYSEIAFSLPTVVTSGSIDHYGGPQNPFPALETINGTLVWLSGGTLPSLTSVTGGVVVPFSSLNTPVLVSVGGLQLFEGHFVAPLLELILGNAEFNSLYTTISLPELQMVTGDMTLKGPNGLQGVDSLVLDSVGGALTFSDGIGTTAMHAPYIRFLGDLVIDGAEIDGETNFPELIEMTGNIGVRIRNNSGSGSIHLSRLEHTGGGNLTVHNNSALSGFSIGPDYVGSSTTDGTVSFTFNPALPQCDINAVNDTLGNNGFFGTFSFNNNGPPCN